MTKLADVIFIVEGRGEFPLDMLRYDRCFPASENDANKAQWGTGELRKVEVVRPGSTRHWHPTTGRWESFGWIVTQVRVLT